MTDYTNQIKKQLLRSCSSKILQALCQVQHRQEELVYLVGGTLRDWLVGKESEDLDFAVQDHALKWVKALQEELGGGTIVDLSGPKDETYRLVWHGEQLDISSFREGADTIEKDLALRDFTINALAAEIHGTLTVADIQVIDPTGGLVDLDAGVVRHLSGAFEADPIRMLRGYRMFAQYGFEIGGATRREVRKYKHLIEDVAVERVTKELQLIFDSDATSEALQQMADDGLLQLLLPELYTGRGVKQPEFHHLDVFDHSFLALKMMEQVLAEPQQFFPEQQELIQGYLQQRANRRLLKWAALMHDIGKPVTWEKRSDKGGRVTFYRHDIVGRRIFTSYGERSHWSGADCAKVAELIEMHMHPFHLCNVTRETELSKRAALKLSHRAGEDLVGLFLLSMADSLAGSGEKKPENMEAELAELFNVVQKIFTENIKPVLAGPRLLTGNDLITRFGLEPGPLFGLIMRELEAARVEGEVQNEEDAVRWVEDFLKTRGPVAGEVNAKGRWP